MLMTSFFSFGRDESFNSITGLNGSGKSNILDAICFVLGITNMSTVRAQNLQVWLYGLFVSYNGGGMFSVQFSCAGSGRVISKRERKKG